MGLKLVVLTAGINWERFKKNPVMLYMHNYDKLIGKWSELEVAGDEVFAKPVFNAKNAFAKEKQQEVTDGFLNGASLGLTPVEWANGAAYGFEEDVVVLAKSEANEVSLVTVGGNANALQLYKADGTHFSEEDVKQVQLGLPARKNSIKPNNHMEFKKLIILALGMKDTSTDEEVLQFAQTVNKQLKDANEKLTALEQARQVDLKKLVDGAIELAKANGRIAGDNAAEQEANYRELLNSNFELGMKMLNNLPAAKPAAVNLVHAVQDAGNAKVAPSDERKNWKLADYHKNAPAELAKMKAEDKPAYIALCKSSGVDEADIQW